MGESRVQASSQEDCIFWRCWSLPEKQNSQRVPSIFRETPISIHLSKSQSIQCKPISATNKIEKFKIFEPYFAQLHIYLKETPPIQQPMRFGNKAFKDWFEKAKVYTEEFIDKLIPEKIAGAKG